MRKIYFLLVGALMFPFIKADAQCSMPGRYSDQIFSVDPSVDMTSVQYSSTITADSMDIYQPHGDTYTNRPLIIMAHGGSFIGGSRRLDAGSNTDVCVDTFCLRFARRGYVTVSIDYRLASSPLEMVVGGTGSGTAADVVAKAISDGKAAIRYLSQHASTYGIDTNNIYIGGNSAGAVLFMHVGYIDSIAQCTPLMLAALNDNGGFDGNSGNPGYTTKAKAVINMAGALASVGIVTAGDIPSVNAQGDQDATVPYTCNKPLSGSCPDTLCGLGSLEPQYVAMGINHASIVFPGQGHVPWDGDAAMMNTVDSLTNVFLYNLVCNGVSSVNNVNANAEVNVFPNPASEVLNVSARQAVSSIMMYDETGRVLVQADNINKSGYQLNTSRLGSGIYFIRIKFADENYAPVVRKVVIQ